MASEPALSERANVGRIIVHVSIGVIAIEALWVAGVLLGSSPDLLVTLDYRIYRAAAERFMDGGGFYLQEQFVGPDQIEIGDILYPPVILWLLVPFLVLPPVFWWAIPIGLSVFGIWRLRPADWAWPLIAALCVWPRLPQIVIHGNPTMWVVAFAILAILYGWPGPFVFIKPVLAPFALLGSWRRTWWAGLAVFLGLCLPFGGLWVQWIQVTLTSGGAIYAFGDYQTMLLPLLLWAARTRGLPDQRTGIRGRLHSWMGDATARARRKGRRRPGDDTGLTELG